MKYFHSATPALKLKQKKKTQKQDERNNTFEKVSFVVSNVTRTRLMNLWAAKQKLNSFI